MAEFNEKNFNSNNGMLTYIWGPSFWHILHTISFNYPTNPTIQDKRNYKNFFKCIQHVLPCSHCRKNVVKNMVTLPLTNNVFKNRNTLSLWVFKLHNKVNKMLGKKNKLTYKIVRNRYENFRSRCNSKKKYISNGGGNIYTKKKENGCTEPVTGVKSKCILQIVPINSKKKTFKISKNCLCKVNGKRVYDPDTL